MKHLALAALGAAMIMGGCVAYPVDGYHDRTDHRNYREQNRHDDRNDRGNWRRDRDRADGRDGQQHGDRP